MEHLFPKKVGGQPAHYEHDKQGHHQSEKRDAVTFGNGRAKLNQHPGEHWRQGIEVFEQKLQNEPGQCDRQGNQQPSNENISKSALEFFNHSGNDGLEK